MISKEVELLKRKLELYNMCLIEVKKQENQITIIETKMLGLPKISKMGVKSSVHTSMEEWLTIKDGAVKELESMSEYWIIKEVNAYLRCLGSNEKELIRDKFFLMKTYKQLEKKYGYTAQNLNYNVDKIIEKMIEET